MIVKISNGNKEIILDFDEISGELFVEAVNNCIKKPTEYPSINYNDKKDTIIFTAEYLKNSLIIIPKSDTK